MSVSVDPIVGFDLTSSLASNFGVSLTFALGGGATRDATGLILTASGSNVSVALPPELQLALPISFMVRAVRSGVGTTDAYLLAARQTAGNSAWGLENRGASAMRVRGLNAATNVALNTSHTPVNPSTVTYFVELTAATYKAWADTSAILTDTNTRANPTYNGTELLRMGINTLGATITHAAIWGALLSAGDRTALVANPLAYMPAPPAYIPTAALMTLLHGAP